MGQAKNRGTFEQRVAQAQAREARERAEQLRQGEIARLKHEQRQREEFAAREGIPAVMVGAGPSRGNRRLMLAAALAASYAPVLLAVEHAAEKEAE